MLDLPVSPLNNSTYLSFNLGRRRMEVYQSIRTYQFRIRKSQEKSSELAELLKLVDPKATATTKKDQLIVYLKTRIYPHITGQI
jgi:hypothetical protein